MAKDIRVVLELDDGQFQKNIKQSQNSVKSFEKNGVASFGKVAAAVGGLIAAAKGLSGIVTTGAKFQDLEDSLNAVFGSAEQGAKAFDRIKKFSQSTQFGVDTLTNAFIQLKGAGVEPTEELLMTFADTASVTTDQMGTFQAALDLVSRSTAGGLGLEDLNRLADRGIPVFQILKEQLGITRLEVSEFGKTTEGANQIIEALTDGLNERFGGTLQTKLDNVSVKFSNMQIAVQELASEIFVKLEPVLVDIIDHFTTLANDAADFVGSLNDIEGIANRTKESLDKVVEVLKDFSAVVAVIVAGALGRSLITLFIAAKDGVVVFAGLIKSIASFRKIALGAFLLVSVKLFELVSMFNLLGDTVSVILVNAFKIMANTIMGIVAGIGQSIITAFTDVGVRIIEFLRSGFDTDKLFGEGAGLGVSLSEGFAQGFENGANLFDLDPAVKKVQDKFQTIDLFGIFGEEEEGGITDMGFIIDDQAAKVSDAVDNKIIPSVSKLKTFLMDISEEIKTNFLATLSQATRSLSDDLADALMTGESALEGFKDFFKSVVSQLISDAIRLAVIQPILTALFGGIGIPLSFVDGKASIKPKAIGGAVMKNRPYLVGEQGPELFVPNGSGSITPNNRMGGGGTNITYNIQALDPRSFKEILAQDPSFVYAVTRAGARKLPGVV